MPAFRRREDVNLGQGIRLTCPNCGAQYAVDASVIPAEGRDVQCSSCGHTWFQVHPDTAMQPAEPPAEHALPQRTTDKRTLDILREEAEREMAVRAAERSTLESQSELAVPEPSAVTPRQRPHPPAPDYPAAVAPSGPSEQGEEAQTASDMGRGAVSDEERASRPAPRRKSLPDIEEISSTLSETGEDISPIATAARRARERQGRRLGFGLAVALFAALAMLYVQGPRLAAAVPAFAPALDAYVATVDRGRLWLDGALRAAVEPIQAQGGPAAADLGG